MEKNTFGNDKLSFHIEDSKKKFPPTKSDNTTTARESFCTYHQKLLFFDVDPKVTTCNQNYYLSKSRATGRIRCTE